MCVLPFIASCCMHSHRLHVLCDMTSTYMFLPCQKPTSTTSGRPICGSTPDGRPRSLSGPSSTRGPGLPAILPGWQSRPTHRPHSRQSQRSARQLTVHAYSLRDRDRYTVREREASACSGALVLPLPYLHMSDHIAYHSLLQ